MSLSRVAVVALAVACWSKPAFASGYPEAQPYIGAHVGGNLVLRDWELGYGAREGGRLPAAFNPAFGLRAGWQIDPMMSAELGAGLMPLHTTDDLTAGAMEWDLELVRHLSSKDWTPYGLVGVGGYHAYAGDLGFDFDPKAQVGVGLRGLLTSWSALRVEARVSGSDGFDAIGATNVELRVGIDVFPLELGPQDEDEDGILDEDDACMTVPGTLSGKGCPDQDGDAVIDTADACIDVPGSAEFGGCNDADRDGLLDHEDTCPKDAGPKELGGCPDGDKDGIADKDDTCPAVAGIKEFEGCPDTDSDGLTDAKDTCPTEAGPKSLGGCPDKDKDGVADKDDQCPEIAGLKSQKGCLPDEVKKYTGAIKGITFETNSAKIKPASFKTLDAAVGVLKQFPDAKVRIEGHTDDQGDDASNLKLSEERAVAVKTYLVSKGVSADQLIAKGFGETQPVADNATEAGRAQNRRIEFKIADE